MCLCVNMCEYVSACQDIPALFAAAARIASMSGLPAAAFAVPPPPPPPPPPPEPIMLDAGEAWVGRVGW